MIGRMRKWIALIAMVFSLVLPVMAAGQTAEQATRQEPAGQAADSVVAEGFWTRYSRHPRMVAVDTAYEARQLQLEKKRVRLIYDVDFVTYFDNREYEAPYQIPQTIFNTRLSPSIGVRILDRAGGQHSFMGGVRYTQRLGGNWSDVQFDPTVYYRYLYRGFDLVVGAIPYEQRIRPLPDWLMYDSVTYMHPNIQGALFSYRDHRGYVSMMCDWRGARTWTRREMFRIVIDGEFRYKWLTVGGMAHLNHTACTDENGPNESLYDDLNVSPNIGVNMNYFIKSRLQTSPMDSLALRVNYIYGFARDRRNGISYQPQGLMVELYANWWLLGVKNVFYYGDNLQPFRGDIGDKMCQGDPFYQSRLYNRTDFFVYLYRSSFVNFYFSWNMHYDTHQLQHQQQLLVRFNLDGLLHHRDEKPYLRNLFDK